MKFFISPFLYPNYWLFLNFQYTGNVDIETLVAHATLQVCVTVDGFQIRVEKLDIIIKSFRLRNR